MQNPILVLSLAVVTIFPCACAANRADAGKPLTAFAEMLDERGAAIGTAELRQVGDAVVIEMKVTGLTPGEHALHIHNTGNCHAKGPDGKAFGGAGAHFNPTGKKHGKDNPEGPHAGDLPNFTADASGRASVLVENRLVTLAEGRPNSLFQPGGTCLVIHAGPDDYKSDPSGNAGDRVACGVIVRK